MLSNGNTQRQIRIRASMIEKVVDPRNLWKAIQKVKANHGAPGIDGITVDELESQVRKYYLPLIRKLKADAYRPQPVKRVHLPKPPDGIRQTGHPPGTGPNDPTGHLPSVDAGARPPVSSLR